MLTSAAELGVKQMHNGIPQVHSCDDCLSAHETDGISSTNDTSSPVERSSVLNKSEGSETSITAPSEASVTLTIL